MRLKEILDKFTSNLLIITLLCYGVGMLYYVSFYSHFDVPIIYYLSINDMLLFTVKIAGTSIFIALFLEVLFYDFLGSVIRNFYNKIYKKDYTVEEAYDRFLSFFQTLSILLVMFFVHPLSSIKDGLFLYMVTPILAYAFAAFKTGRDFRFNEKPIQFILITTLFILYISMSEAGVVLVDRYKTKIAFNTDKTYIHTFSNSNYFYVGETTSNLFIYDESLDATLAYSKSEIKNLKYFRD